MSDHKGFKKVVATAKYISIWVPHRFYVAVATVRIAIISVWWTFELIYLRYFIVNDEFGIFYSKPWSLNVMIPVEKSWNEWILK